jgi:hypothetical protein
MSKPHAHMGAGTTDDEDKIRLEKDLDVLLNMRIFS